MFVRLAAFALIAIGLAGAPALAQTAPAPGQARPADPFGEDVMLASKTLVFSKGSANWDSAFDTLVEAFKKIHEALDKQGVKASGPAMTIYTATDDTGFEFQAGIPVAEAPKGPLPEGLAVGNSPDGRALKFIHRGSYDAMDSTYEAITEGPSSGHRVPGWNTCGRSLHSDRTATVSPSSS